MDKVTVCIAARNEGASILSLLRKVKLLGYKVVLINDASTDDTGRAAMFEDDQLTVIHNATRLGIAASLMRAWRRALEDGAEYILQMDAGYSHDPEQLPALVSALKRGYGMVIGSRYMPGAQYIGNPRRKLMSRVAASALNFAMPKHTHTDWTSGFRGYRPFVVEDLLKGAYTARMHAWQIETLARAERHGAIIGEVPIAYRAGRSSFNLRAASEAFGVWLQVLFS